MWRAENKRVLLAVSIAVLSFIAFCWTIYDYHASLGSVFLAVKKVSEFYTHWAMLTIAVSFMVIAKHHSERVRSVLIGNALILVMIMTVMYVIIKGFSGFVDSSLRLKIEHAIVPGMILSYWLFFSEKTAMKPIDPIIWTAQPIIYTIYTLARGARSGQYPYEIANAGKNGYALVLSLVVIITIASVLIGYFIVYANNRLLARHRLQSYGQYGSRREMANS